MVLRKGYGCCFTVVVLRFIGVFHEGVAVAASAVLGTNKIKQDNFLKPISLNEMLAVGAL